MAFNPKNFYNNNKKIIKNAGLIFAVTFGSSLFYKLVYKVEPGSLAIKFNIFNGVGTHVYKEGIHLLIPYVEKPIVYDCKMKNYMHNCICGTKDLQIVTIKTRVVCRPNISKLPDLYRLLGNNYDDRVLLSIIHEICGIAVSQFNASQIISQRDMVSYIIKQRITEKARDFFIDVDDVALIDIHFSKEFSEAIEQKQVAQQEAEKTKILVEQALEEKKATIIRALGETESVKKFGEANHNSQAYLTLRKLETSKKISYLLSNSKNKAMLDSNSFFMNIPIQPVQVTNKSI